MHNGVVPSHSCVCKYADRDLVGGKLQNVDQDGLLRGVARTAHFSPPHAEEDHLSKGRQWQNRPQAATRPLGAGTLNLQGYEIEM